MTPEIKEACDCILSLLGWPLPESDDWNSEDNEFYERLGKAIEKDGIPSNEKVILNGVETDEYQELTYPISTNGIYEGQVPEELKNKYPTICPLIEELF